MEMTHSVKSIERSSRNNNYSSRANTCDFAQVDILRALCGKYYDGIEMFFEKIFQSDHDVKIFMTRRGFILYEIFDEILKGRVEFTGLAITDTSIYAHQKYIKGKKVLIVDDTLTQGRNVIHLKDILINTLLAKEVECKVLAKSADAQEKRKAKLSNNKGLQPLINHYYETSFYYELNILEYRRFSKMITECFQALLKPYVSAVPIFRTSKSLLDANCGRITKEGSFSYCKYRYILTDHFIENREGKIDAEYIRIYWNDLNKDIAVVPFILLNSTILSSEFLNGFFGLFDDVEATEFSKLLHRDDMSDLSMEYKCKLVIYLICLIYGKKFFVDAEVDLRGIHLNFGGVVMNFGKISEPLARRFWEQDIESDNRVRNFLAEFNISDSDKINYLSSVSTDSKNLLDELGCKISKFGGLLKNKPDNFRKGDYLYAALRVFGKIDEKRIYEVGNIVPWLTLEWLRARMKEDSFDSDETIRELLIHFDLGTAVLKLKHRESKTYQMLSPGESSPFCYMTVYIVMMYVIHSLNNVAAFSGVDKTHVDMATEYYRKFVAEYCSSRSGLFYLDEIADLYLKDLDMNYEDDNTYYYDEVLCFTEDLNIKPLLDKGTLLSAFLSKSVLNTDIETLSFETAFEKYCNPDGVSGDTLTADTMFEDAVALFVLDKHLPPAPQTVPVPTALAPTVPVPVDATSADQPVNSFIADICS